MSSRDGSLDALEAVIFTQPHCAPCRDVERYLTDRGVPFVLRDVLADEEALAVLESKGYMGTPVTQLGTHWIAGFRRSEFDRVLSALRSEPNSTTD